MGYDALTILFDYTLHLLPGLCLCAAWLCLTPRACAGLRIAILIMGFMLARDMMTPLHLWHLGGQPPIRFHANPCVLALLGGLSLALIAALARLTPELWRLMIAFKGNRVIGISAGLAAGCLIALPIRHWQAMELAPWSWLWGFLVLAIGGNALEEVLFRGLLQGCLELRGGRLRAAFASAVAFSACHGFLAMTLPEFSGLILSFTLVEGLACALVRMKWGTVPAVVVHATTIALLGAPIT